MPKSQLDPNLRERLLKETKAPWRGLRRTVWFALFGSAIFGVSIMALRSSSGVLVPLGDFAIQLVAITVFGGLIFIDREKSN